MSDRLMSTADVAQVLGKSEATIKRWANAGMLTCIRTPGGHRKFRLRNIAQHLAPSGPSRAPGSAPDEAQGAIDAIMRALMVGDVDGLVEVVSSTYRGPVSMAVIAETLLQPAYRRILEASSEGRCEAFYRHIAYNTLAEATARRRGAMGREPGARGRLVTAPHEGNRWDVTARLAALTATEAGFEAYVFSDGLSAFGMARAVQELGAGWILLCGDLVDDSGLADTIEAISGGTDARLVCVGEWVAGRENLADDVLTAANLTELERLLVPTAFRMAR